jgi:nucleoside-diphosphate-sugar epimerase
MNILITGVAGAIGSHVAEALVAQGHTVRGIDSLSTYYSPALKKINIEDLRKVGVEVFNIDLAEAELGQYVEGAEAVYHFAAQPGISAQTPFSEYVRNNITATYRLLEAVKHAGSVQLFVHASTSSVYGKQANGDETVEPKPTSYYGVTKLAAEQLALAYQRDQGLPVSVLRFFSVYGERERPDKLYHKFIACALNKKPFPLHEGSRQHIRSYTYIGDIVDGCLRVLQQKEKAIGEIFNLGTDKTITTGEGIDILEKILGEKAVIDTLPKRPGDQVETAANIGKARRILGYDPKITPQEGLAKEVAWYKEKVLGKV